MKASEILHGLADLLAGLEHSQSQQNPNQAALTPVSKFTPQNQEPDSVQQAGTFVPPLQAKIELLKKAVNVDSIYDETGPDEDLTGQGADNEDELEIVKKLSGINPVVQFEAGDDEPLDV